MFMLHFQSLNLLPSLSVVVKSDFLLPQVDFTSQTKMTFNIYIRNAHKEHLILKLVLLTDVLCASFGVCMHACHPMCMCL